MIKILLPALNVNGGSIYMGQATEQLKNIDIRTVTEAKNDTSDLVRYGVQIAMLNRLLSHKLITEIEYHKISEQLKKDYEIASVA